MQAADGAEDSASNGNKHSSLRNTLLLAIPTAFDLTATILMSVGLLFVTASVYQVRHHISQGAAGATSLSLCVHGCLQGRHS